MKPRKRVKPLDHPTLDELKCLILHEEDSKGFNAEAVMLQQLYAFALQHGWGRLQQMVEGMHEIWNDPDSLEDFKKKHQQHLDYNKTGIKVFDEKILP